MFFKDTHSSSFLQLKKKEVDCHDGICITSRSVTKLNEKRVILELANTVKCFLNMKLK